MDSLSTINISEILTISFALFAVIDMLGSIPLFITMNKKMGEINAFTATVVSGALMLLFFLAGGEMLKMIGLDIPSFAIAGSIIIFILGMEMTLGIEMFKTDKNESRAGSIVPIAFPIIAGSGTLTTIMSLKAVYHFYNVLIGILVNLVIIFVILKSINLIEKVLGPAGILVIRKFFGVILIAISVKIFRTYAHV